MNNANRTSLFKSSNFSSLVKCGSFLLALSLTTNFAFAKVEEEFRESFPLNSEGDVSIVNVNGPIKITGWDREEISVFAVKKGKNQDMVDRIEIVIDSDAKSFSLETKLPKGKNTNASVAYEIIVPFGVSLSDISSVNGSVSIEGIEGKVKASTVNGAVKALELKGDVDLSTVNGSVKAIYLEAPRADSIRMNVVNGSLTLEIPNDTSAYFKASSVNGGIRSEIDLPVKRGFPFGAHIKAQKGEGGPNIHLSSVNGRISIKEN